ncbi:MAG TPA: Fic family protein [Bacillota bacterium]|nr:Fic family protein [Bacillota bacterium]
MNDYFVDGEAFIANKLGIEDAGELKKAEEEIVAARMTELMEHPIHGSFDFNMLLEIHRKLFSDIYDFAGQIRRVRIAKDSSVFCYPEFIEENQKRIFDRLRDMDYLKNLDKSGFVREFAWLSGELNALHPFREGNGRSIRLFLKLLAELAGWYVAYEDMDARELMEADIQSFNGDSAPLARLMEKHVECA